MPGVTPKRLGFLLALRSSSLTSSKVGRRPNLLQRTPAAIVFVTHCRFSSPGSLSPSTAPHPWSRLDVVPSSPGLPIQLKATLPWFMLNPKGISDSHSDILPRFWSRCFLQEAGSFRSVGSRATRAAAQAYKSSEASCNAESAGSVRKLDLLVVVRSTLMLTVSFGQRRSLKPSCLV